MNDEEMTLTRVLADFTSDARAPHGPHIRSVAHKRSPLRGSLITTSTAAACLALVVGVASVTGGTPEARPAAEDATVHYAWGRDSFDYPAEWSLAEVDVQSRGRIHFGPYISNARLREQACQSIHEERVSCDPLAMDLEPGQVLAQWLVLAGPGLEIAQQKGEEERLPDGRILKTFVRPAESECVAYGGTTSVDMYVADDAVSHPRALHACVDEGSEDLMRQLRSVVTSIEWPRGE